MRAIRKERKREREIYLEGKTGRQEGYTARSAVVVTFSGKERRLRILIKPHKHIRVSLLDVLICTQHAIPAGVL